MGSTIIITIMIKRNYFKKRIIVIQKLKSQKISLCRTEASSTSIWTKSALENLKEITQLDLLPKQLILKDFDPETNPHLHLCVCGICENLLRKPLIMKSCQHAFCFLCLSIFSESNPGNSTFCPILK